MLGRLIFAVFCLYNMYKAWDFSNTGCYDAANYYLGIVILAWILKMWGDMQNNHDKIVNP
jgi:hypothetical protein